MYGFSFMKTALRKLHPAPQKDDITIERSVVCFSSTSLPLSALLSIFSSLGVILMPLGVVNSKRIWVRWCKVLTRFSYIHIKLYLPKGKPMEINITQGLLQPNCFIDWCFKNKNQSSEPIKTRSKYMKPMQSAGKTVWILHLL